MVSCQAVLWVQFWPIGFHDDQFFENVQSLTLCYQYVDDTFTLFADEHDAVQFFD